MSARGKVFPDPTGASACVVLRIWPTGETSVVSSLLSEEHGYLKVIAKGARTQGSRLRGLVQPGSLAEMEYSLRDDRELQYLRGGRLLRAGLDAAAGLERTACLLSVLELIDRCRLEDARTTGLFAFCRDYLRMLSSATGADGEMARFYAFELLMLRLHGLAPVLDRCAGCGGEIVDAPVLAIDQGGLVCPDCREAARGTGLRRLSSAARAYLERLQDPDGGDPGDLPPPIRGVRREAGIALHDFLTYHLTGYRLPAGLDLLRPARPGPDRPEDADTC